MAGQTWPSPSPATEHPAEDPGSLTVTKTRDGAGAELYGAGPFEVSLTCTYTNVDGDEVPVNTPGGATRELTAENDYTAQYAPLLFGSTCQIEETKTGGATSTAITNADGEPVTEFAVDSLTEELQLTATNTFDVGSIRVTKTVVGDGPGSYDVELAWAISVRNRKDVPITVELREPIGGEWKVIESSHPATKVDAGTIGFTVEVPAGKEVTVTYRAQIAV